MVHNSNYMKCSECERHNWLVKNSPESYEQDEAHIFMENTTKEAKELAKKLFKGVQINEIDASYETQKALKNNCTLFDAYFENDVASCTVDILVMKNSKADIYLVKSGVNIYYFAKELSFQKMVLKSKGINVKNMYLILIDRDYVRGKKLNIKKLFKITNVNNLDNSRNMYKRAAEIDLTQSLPCEPYSEVKKYCQHCGFFEYCFKDLPKPNIFEISGMDFATKLNLYNRGIVSFKDFVEKNEETDKAYMKQINCTLSNKPMVNKAKLREFLGNLKYPIGFLDFETVAPLIPEFDKNKVGELIITQFSYHVIEKEGEKPKHYEFIGDGITYPEKDLCKALIEYIKPNHTVLMYSPYEKTCINHLISKKPSFAKELEAIKKNLVDLEQPFRKKYLYHPLMQGRSSIKKVLPALYPHSKKLGYENLEVKNGAMAVEKYMNLKNLPKAERLEMIEKLLNYCCMDTLAMVALVEKIKEYAR